MIWSIGDLHFDHTKDKSMDIFGENWKNHEDKIIQFWKENVKDQDLILVPGDISWALKLEDSIEDLKKIDDLPGKKCFVKGNHDYWWATKLKLDALNLETIYFIYNDHYEYEDFIISGTRGWYPRDSELFTESDEKIYKRELLRLESSLKSYKGDLSGKKRIVMVHYPPFDFKGRPNDFLELMIEYNVNCCVYGHLHGEGHQLVKEGNYSGVDIHCVSSDYIDFKLKKLF